MEVEGHSSSAVENKPSCNLKIIHSREQKETLIYLLDRHVASLNPERVHGDHESMIAM